MTNDDLKKKIADIIYHTGCLGACCECAYSKISEADTYCKAMLKANTLIAAGIGDVKAAEHRAEVAERALELACIPLWAFGKAFGDGATEEEVEKRMIKRAEKELLKEKQK